ncbi:MAG TPA: prepilin-type N-terminal cleavage/methylation domain-containing protein [Candidatus Acidoferrales bacterium]|nr:prepilin-type N-terminal cleavage/methylation domain-containing protein [Candidatus Acidoferrales bacterium]
MTIVQKFERQKGFTLIEIMVAMAVFLVICGAMFGLMNMSQKRYQTESQVLDSFQQARLGLDEVVRDASDAGYPPPNNFSANTCGAVATCFSVVNSPIAWRPGYVAQNPCQIGTAGGGTCVTPGDFDVIFEENPDNTTVKWIRYQLVGTTLFRGWVKKSSGASALNQTNQPGVMFPYITNVMNNASAAQIAQYRASYPAMFPGGNPQPIFQYYCPNPAAPPALILCQNAFGNITVNGISLPANSPSNVVDVEVTLIVRATRRDAQTGAPRLVELNGRGHLINPNH